MEVIEYFSAENPEYWLAQIQKSDWVAGKFLHRLLTENSFHDYASPNARVLLLTDGDSLISFCILTDQDDIETTELKPWVGFVYTFPKYRGNRYAGRLIDHAACLAKQEGHDKIYLSTDQPGIYENYGFGFLAVMKDRRGGDSSVYVRNL